MSGNSFRSWRGAGIVAAALVVAAPVAWWAVTASSDAALTPPGEAGSVLDLSADNRRTPVAGLYDWSHAGYRGDGVLPGDAQFSTDPDCRIAGDALGIVADDDTDDSEALQTAIDTVGRDCGATAGYDRLSLITLPAGQIDISRQIAVDVDFLVIRGAGDDADGTRIVFRPDENTRYDTISEDGSVWDSDEMDHRDGEGGWLWPGRGLFRVQSRQVHEDYREDYASAPENRRDLFEGTVNVHWKSGARLSEAPGDRGFSAREGDTVVHLDEKADMSRLRAGGFVNIRAANSLAFYREQNAVGDAGRPTNLHMRQQIFTIAAADEQRHTITLDKPLEFDLPVDSTSDGSEEIDGKVYDSKAAPLVDPVQGVGFEGFSFTQDMPGLDADAAVDNYGNMAPEAAMHGIVFKWAVDSWVRGVTADMAGSHPVVTEEAYHLQIEGNTFTGSWNKGAGGNGYLRGSRVWDSLYASNVTRGLRHFTFQWSASGNVVIGNDFDSDLNLHGGWERNNLFELNTVRVGFAHSPGNCADNCGGEGGSPDASTWYPIYWAAGQKGLGWSGSSGPRNVFFNNDLSKQLDSPDAPFEPYYEDPYTVFQFGWDGTEWHHLDIDGTPIPDWASVETTDFAGSGVDTSITDEADSLFLTDVSPLG